MFDEIVAEVGSDDSPSDASGVRSVPESDSEGGKPGFKPIVLDSQDAVDGFMKARIARVEKKYSDYNDLKAKAAHVDELEAASLSESEKLQKRLAEFEKLAADKEAELTKLQRDRVVSDVASEMGLPKKFWDRVRGDTDDEIISDITDLLEGLPKPEKDKGSPPGQSPKVKVQPTGSDPEVQMTAEDILKSIPRGFAGTL